MTKITWRHCEGRVQMSTLRKARENASDEGAIGFSFASDWLGD